MADQTPEENPENKLQSAREQLDELRRAADMLRRDLETPLPQSDFAEAVLALNDVGYEIARAEANIRYWERVVNGDWARMDWRDEENE